MFGWFSAASILRFALEARQAIRVARERIRQDLDRDVAIEPRVARAVHLAHPARAQQRQDFELPDVRTRSDRDVGSIDELGCGSSLSRLVAVIPDEHAAAVGRQHRHPGLAAFCEPPSIKLHHARFVVRASIT